MIPRSRSNKIVTGIEHNVGVTREMTTPHKPAPIFGIRPRILIVFLILLLVPLIITGYIGMRDTRMLGEQSCSDVVQMGDTAVNESTDALNNLAREKLEGIARECAERSDFIVNGAVSDTKILATKASQCFATGDTAELDRIVNIMLQNTPKYEFIDYDGTKNGMWLLRYQHVFVLDETGYLHSISGTPDRSSAVGQVYNDQHYFVKAWDTFRSTGSSYFIYDPFLYNDTAGNGYWEPGENAEDMIVLPHRDLKPFSVVLPSNLELLQSKTYSDQHNPKTMVHPDDGNWNSDQLGLIVMAPVKVNGEERGIAGVVLSLPAVTHPVREVKWRELREEKEGYSYMFNANGILVAHQDKEHIGSDSSWHKWVAYMLNDDSGFISYEWRDRYRFVAYDQMTTTGWRIAITSLNTDFIQPALDTKQRIDTVTKDTEAEIDTSTNEVRNEIVIFAIIFIIAALVSGILLANRIIRPINQLTMLADKIRTGDLGSEVVVEAKDEVGILALAFANILTTLRMGNVAYYKGDTRKALDSFRRGLVLFETSGNEKGIAMCYNNIGNIYRRWGAFDDAMNYYKKALAIGRKLNDQVGIKSRLNNIGTIYKLHGDLATALNFYKEALEIDNALGDKDGMATRYNNMGIVLRDWGKVENAMTNFKRAVELGKEIENIRDIACGYSNMGTIYVLRRNYTSAMECFLTALRLSHELGDVRQMAVACSNISNLYKKLGDKEKAVEYDEMVQKIKHALTTKKSVMLLIDKSGSMDGEKIIAAKQGAINVLRSKIHNGDRVGIIEFDHETKLTLPLTPKTGNESTIVNAIEGITIGGQTAFYDALGEALSHLKSEGGSDVLWVVALTDGEDNSSQKFNVGQPGWFFTWENIVTYNNRLGVDINLIIIGVGADVQENILQIICENARMGRYIRVEETADSRIGAAIKDAYVQVEKIFEDEEEVELYVPEE